jgi:hypothetical protein
MIKLMPPFRIDETGFRFTIGFLLKRLISAPRPHHFLRESSPQRHWQI